jgi:hypothetical protein
MKLITLAIASATFACATMLSLGWSEQGGVSLSSNQTSAQARIVIRPYASSAVYFHSADLPWYAVRAYYHGGPWSGDRYSYASRQDYATGNGIACVPGSASKGQDGIMYRCQ